MKYLSLFPEWKFSRLATAGMTMLFIILFSASGWASTYYSKTSGNANSTGTWGLNSDGTGTAPSNFTTSGDLFILRSVSTLGLNGTLTIGTGVTLQVDGYINVTGNNDDININGTILFTKVTGNQITLGGGGSGTNFTLGASATLITANQNGISGASCSLPASAWKADVTLPTTANYEFNGGNQSTLGLPSTVNNLTFSGTGTKTLLAALTVSSELAINTGASANLGSFNSTTGTLTLGGSGADLGSWGSTASTATYKNSTYFGTTATGILNVQTRSCPAISATISGTNTICSGSSTNLVVTITGGTGPYTVVYAGGSGGTVTNYTSGDNISVSPASTTSYSLTSVTDANGCTATKSGTATITVSTSVTTPVFTLGSASTRCQGAGTVTYSATVSNALTTTFTLDNASLTAGNTIFAGTGAVTYVAGWSGTSIITVRATGCNGPTTATHTVTITPTVGVPVFALGATSTRCQGAGVETYTATAANSSALTYSLDAASLAGGNTITAGTGAVSYSAGWSGTTFVTVNATGCNGPASAVHTIAVNKTPDVIYSGVTTICNGSTTGINLSGSVTGTTFTWTIGTVTGGITGASASSGAVIAQTLINPGTAQGSVTYVVTPSANSCTGPASNIVVTVNPELTVSATPTDITCIGSLSGIITVSGNGGQVPYQYKLNSGIYQSGNIFSNLAPGTYTVWILDALSCSNSIQVTVGLIASPTDDQNSAGVNNWKGHVYDGIGFTTYAGYITQPESFSTNFGADNDTYCIPLLSNGNPRGSILNQTFSVRFRMNSDKNGLYLIDLLSDDGIGLSVDGTRIFLDWTDHALRPANNVLVPLTGSNQLVLEYYENGGQNDLAYNNIRKIQNSLTDNINQAICEGETPASISGNLILDDGNALPVGIAPSYKWYYLKSPSATWIEIAGETGASYSPSSSLFNLPGTYSIKRLVTITSSNNTGATSTVSGISETNVATIVVSPTPNASISYPGSPYCFNAESASVTLTGTPGGTFSSSPAGLTIDASTGAISVNSSTPGTYTITYTISAAGGCGIFTTTTSVVIVDYLIWTGAINSDWNVAGNWSCSVIPDLTRNVQVPAVANQPVLNAGAAGMAKDLTIASGSSLTILGNTIQIAGSITNDGTFTATTGTVEMKGSSAQNIGEGVFSGNTIMNLTINNSAGTTLQGPLNITGIVKAISGNLTTGGNLVLLSSAGQTALIDGTGAGEVMGSITMQRYLPSAFGYKYFSSPFQSSTVYEFADDLDLNAAFPTFYMYDEDNHRDSSGIPVYASGWVKYLATSNFLTPMQGYAANFGNVPDAKTVDLTGNVNNGPMQVSLLNHGRKYTKGFNLTGNPYPSPIDWNSAGWTKTNIDNAVYFFNAGNTDQYLGVYSSYVDGIATGNGSNIIASMQGFFVHVSEGTYPVSGILGFTNSIRTSDLNPLFKRAMTENREILRFTAKFETENAIEDVAAVYFDNAATKGFDKEKDALKLANTDVLVPNLYTFSLESKQLSINGLPVLNDSISEIPLGITTLSDGWVVFSASDISLLSGYPHLYLFDAEAGIIQDLKQVPEYRFNLKAGQYNQRFSLVFSIPEINKPADITGKLFSVLRSVNLLKILVNLPYTMNGSLLVTNMSGQVILRQEVAGSQTVEINAGATTGIYVVTVISGKRMQSEKLLIRKDYE